MLFLKIPQHFLEYLMSVLKKQFKSAGEKEVMSGSACNFIKKNILVQLFSCKFQEIFKKSFFTEHLRWLLLKHVCFTNPQNL